MEIKAAFETGAFAATQEIWKKAIEYLGIQNTDGRTHIKRMGTNQIQIFQYDEVDKKSILDAVLITRQRSLLLLQVEQLVIRRNG